MMTHSPEHRRTMWRSTIAFGFVAILVVRGLNAQAAPSGASACLAPTRISANLYDELKDLMVTHDANSSSTLSAYELKRVQPSAVSTIRDAKVCEAASAAYSRAVNSEVSSVHVIRVGDRYLVVNPEIADGDSKTVVTFDATFNKRLATVAY